MLGVLLIAGLITAAGLQMFQSARTKQQRFVAEQELSDLAENVKILYSGRKNYANVSKNFLIKAGAIKTEKLGAYDFRIRSNDDGRTFSIIFDGLNFADCAYFATKKFDWAIAAAVNGSIDKPASACAESALNKIEFISK